MTEKRWGMSIHSITESVLCAMKTCTKNKAAALWEEAYWAMRRLWSVHTCAWREIFTWVCYDAHAQFYISSSSYCSIIAVTCVCCTQTFMHTHLKSLLRSHKSTNSKFDPSSVTASCLLLDEDKTCLCILFFGRGATSFKHNHFLTWKLHFTEQMVL